MIDIQSQTAEIGRWKKKEETGWKYNEQMEQMEFGLNANWPPVIYA